MLAALLRPVEHLEREFQIMPSVVLGRLQIAVNNLHGVFSGGQRAVVLLGFGFGVIESGDIGHVCVLWLRVVGGAEVGGSGDRCRH